MVRMKRCQWDARVELACINLGESAAPGAKRFFQKRALCALRALPKARTDSVQLWAGRALSGNHSRPASALHALSASADVLSSTSRMPPVSSTGRAPVSEYGAGLEQPAAVAFSHFDSEDVPDGAVEATGAFGAETVEDAPVFVGGVHLGAVDLVVWSRKPGRTPLGRCL